MVCGCDLLFQGFKSTSIIYSLTSCENCELHTPFPSLRVFPKELTHKRSCCEFLSSCFVASYKRPCLPVKNARRARKKYCAGTLARRNYNLVAIGYLVGNCQVYVNRQLFQLSIVVRRFTFRDTIYRFFFFAKPRFRKRDTFFQVG